MNYTLFMLPLAVEDGRRAARFYKSEKRGLGKKFRNELALTLRRIESNPYQYAQSESPGIRRALLHVFPFAVYYELYPPKILVFAIHDCRSDPQRWMSRVP